MKEPRLIPLVVFAAAVLLTLKGVHLVTVRGQETAGQADPFAGVVPDPIITAAGGGSKSDSGGVATTASKGAESAKNRVEITDQRPAEAKPIPGQELLSEIAILQKLAERRKMLEAREKEIETREGLLKATEGKIEKRIDDLRTLEQSVGTAAVAKEDEKTKELEDLVKMYESMKAKDAARVFDRLDTKLLVGIARQMNPKKLGDVVAKMSPEAAEKLTVELANRRGREAEPAPGRELPKIEGKGG